MNREEIRRRFTFRTIRLEEAQQAAEIEQICFPPNEACPPDMIFARVAMVPDLFLVAEDRETGKIAGFLNGIATDEAKFRDEFFSDSGLYQQDGKNVMLCGLDVLPPYRRQGLATALVEEYSRIERQKGRQRLVLTCLDEKVPMYEKMGFRDLGEANSTWGGEKWHEMDLPLQEHVPEGAHDRIQELPYRIRKARPEDLEQIMEIYAYARAFMASHGNPNQWGPNQWPPRELIEEDIRCGDSYVCVRSRDAADCACESNPLAGTASDRAGENENPAATSEEILGVFYFVFGEDIEPTYRLIEDGAWIRDGAYGVVHRIASGGNARGVGRFCIDWAYRQCHHLRIDTHTDNKVMQNLLGKMGFTHCGTIFVHEDNDPRLAYEK